MKKRILAIFSVGLVVTVGLLVGCEWTGGGGVDDLNSSRGAGININFSGVYQGMLGGGRAVSQTSAGSIVRLVLTQAGDSVTVVDNQGSTYSGSVGSPGAVAEPSEGSYPAGAELVQAQVSWSGKDEVAQRDIEFVGVIHVISVTDIQGVTAEDKSTDTDTDTRTRTYTVVQGQKTNIVTETTVPLPPPLIGSTKTTITVDAETGREISRTVENVDEDVSTVTRTTQFSITEANSQYRLEGTWIEKDGGSAAVDARSAGTSGIISSDATAPAAQ